MRQTKRYEVEVFRYPELVTVEATSKKEAKETAKNKVDFCVYTTKVY